MRNALLAGAAAITILTGCEKTLNPGDAMVWTQDGVSKIISCDDPSTHPICDENGTDENFDLEAESNNIPMS